MKTVLCKTIVSALNHRRLSGSLKLLTLLFVVSLGTLPFNSAKAVPADPTPMELTQPDGTKIQVRLRGDEFFHWTETTNGYVVVKDADNYWKYAQPVAGRAELQAVPGTRVGSDDPAQLGLRKHALPDPVVLRARVQERRKALNGEPVELSPSNAAAAVQSPNPIKGTPQPAIAVSGTKTITNIVILACFSNHWDSVNNTVLPQYGRVDTNEYNNLYNQIGFTNDGAAGSVKDFYREVSYGKLTIQSIIVAWVELPHEEAYYHNNQNVLAADAVQAAAAAGFNFSQGDSDGDGWVDVLDILHSGYGEESGGGLHPDWVWSVKGSMSSVVTKNGVQMYNYHTEPALRGSSGTGIERIGTICHESGHFFGLPDLYDYSNLTDGLGNWCLMSGGPWNGISGTIPAHPSAWCNLFLGFAKAVPIHSKSGLSLPRVEDNPVVGMLRDGTTNGEYFLIENRAKVGFDNSPQINPGLLIYHVDQNCANNDMGTWPHPAVKVEEADGNDSLGLAGGGAQAGDAWTSTSGLAGGWCDQTGNSNTTAMLYQSNPAPYNTNLLYSRMDNPAYYTYNRLNNFSAAGSTMTLNVQSLKTDAPTQPALPAPYTVTWAPSSQATKYEIQEGSPVTLTSFTDGAESDDAMYANWSVAGKTQCVVTNASHAGSACYVLGTQNYGKIQSLTLRNPFTVTASTAISFYFMSHVSSSGGSLKCDISNDNGNTWKTLGTYNSKIDPWSQRSYNFAAINAAGINSGDACLLRFVADIEYGYGWSGFPAWGFALDDISITGTHIAGYGNWTSLDNNVTTNSYAIAAKSVGTYAYQVQPYANGAWQGFGAAGQITVRANQAPVWNVNPIVCTEADVAIPYAANIANQAGDEVNDVMTFSKVSGPAWLTVFSDGTIAGTPPAGSGGLNSFTVRVTDSAGNHADDTLTIFVNTPVADWRMNESSGPTVHDSVGSFSGTGEGSLVFGQPGAPAGGTGNAAIQFDGTTTDVAVPALNLNTNTVTITGLIKLNGTQGFYPDIFDWGNGNGVELGFGDGDNHLCSVWNGNFLYSNLAVPVNQWVFVAMVITPTATTIYMGTTPTLVSWTHADNNTPAAFDTGPYIGRGPPGYDYFNGWMDDVAIYGKALTGSELAQLAAAALVQQPTVMLTSPANGATLTSTPVNLTAFVVGNGHSVSSVRFYAGLNLLGESTTPPYSYNWSGMTNGSYTLSATTIYDGANLAISAPVTITVSNTVTIATNPTNIVATVSGTNLILSWPGDHTGWTLQAQTNPPSTGLGTNWVDVPGSASVNAVTNTINPTNGSVFYRLKYMQ